VSSLFLTIRDVLLELSMMNNRPVGTSIFDRLVRWCLEHWLTLMNGAVLLYGGVPWLSPVMIAIGHPTIGRILFHLYTPLCHQIPERSFFLMKHQVAYCHRETAMYTTLFIGGLVYAIIRNHLQPISLRLTGYLLLPMVLDGTTQLLNDLLPWVGLRSDNHAIWSLNWWLRMGTGFLFTIAVVTGIYPRLERSFKATPRASTHHSS
jgi:uncharacterized membrane protein